MNLSFDELKALAFGPAVCFHEPQIAMLLKYQTIESLTYHFYWLQSKVFEYYDYAPVTKRWRVNAPPSRTGAMYIRGLIRARAQILFLRYVHDPQNRSLETLLKEYS